MKLRLLVLFALLLWPVAAAASTITHVDGVCFCEPELIPGHPFVIVPDTEPDPPQTYEQWLEDLAHEPLPEPDVPDLWVIVCRFVPFPPLPPTDSEGEGVSEGEGGTEGEVVSEGEGSVEGSPIEGEGGGSSEGEGTVPEPHVFALIGVGLVAWKVWR